MNLDPQSRTVCLRLSDIVRSGMARAKGDVRPLYTNMFVKVKDYTNGISIYKVAKIMDKMHPSRSLTLREYAECPNICDRCILEFNVEDVKEYIKTLPRPPSYSLGTLEANGNQTSDDC